MNFLHILDDLIREFSGEKIDFALMGGHALHFWGVERTTLDLDLVILLKDRQKTDAIMKKLGYDLLYGNEDIANYVSENREKGRIDFLFAHRKYSLEMLARAAEKDLSGRKIKALLPEDLIGLKVQAVANDPSRLHKDLSDIESLLRNNRKKMDMTLVRDYFILFSMEKTLDEILENMK